MPNEYPMAAGESSHGLAWLIFSCFAIALGTILNHKEKVLIDSAGLHGVHSLGKSYHGSGMP
jgi:hypothetical protein